MITVRIAVAKTSINLLCLLLLNFFTSQQHGWKCQEINDFKINYNQGSFALLTRDIEDENNQMNYCGRDSIDSYKRRAVGNTYCRDG